MKQVTAKFVIPLLLASFTATSYAKNNAEPVIPIIAGGAAGDGVASLDNGKTWQTISIDAEHGTQLNDIVWGDNQFVSVGYGRSNAGQRSAIFTSPDGINWTNRYNYPVEFNKVLFVNNLFFVLSSSSNSTFQSADGINWQSIYIPPPLSPLSSLSFWGLAWGDGHYVMTGTCSSESSKSKNQPHVVPRKLFKKVKDSSVVYFTAISTDGVNWNLVTQQEELHDIMWVNNEFIALYGNAQIATSPDGVTWTTESQHNLSSLSKNMAYGNNTYVVMTSSGTSVLTSPDGKTWTNQLLPVSNSFQATELIFKNNQFILGGTDPVLGGMVLASPDGISWSILLENSQNFVTSLG